MSYENKKEKREPDFVGNGVAVWVNEIEKGDNKGDKFLSVQVLGNLYVNCFKNKPKPKKESNNPF